VLISNSIDDAKNALETYRLKDCVEKGFNRFKNSLDLERLRVHSDISMQNKIFVSFIALTISSHIDRIMREKGLFNKWTMREMIMKLEKLRAQYINDTKIIYPATSEQKDILAAFGLKPPE
jgi:transposase